MNNIELVKALLELKVIKRELMNCFFDLEDSIQFSLYEEEDREKVWEALYRLQKIYNIGDDDHESL